GRTWLPGKMIYLTIQNTKSLLASQLVVARLKPAECWVKFLVLTNGIEVKLQRNALSVIEGPTGHEDDDRNECENFLSSSSELAFDDFQKPHKPKQRHHKTVASVSKGLSKNHPSEVQSAGLKQSSHGVLKVDLSKLETTALWRYGRHFNLVDAFTDPTKEQLIDIVQKHFMAQ
ncbi:hypothetical protein KI387_014609, partial [Taxus chinensis]